MKMIKNFTLDEVTTIFFNGETEICFRKGIWNYEEALLDISSFEEELQETTLNIFRELSNGNTISVDELHKKFKLHSKDVEKMLNLLDELSSQHFLKYGDENNTEDLIRNLIGGTATTGIKEEIQSISNTLLICDCTSVAEQLLTMAKNIKLSMSEMSLNDMQRIAKADLTSKLDALDLQAQYDELLPLVSSYSCVLICLQRPHIKLLRNLNRLLLKLGLPFVVCLIDGPFLSVMTIKGYETGCFECYENRVMARLEDTVAYRKFVEKGSSYLKKYDNTYLSPILMMISSLGLFDALLINLIHKAKLAGRIFNIYLPLLEVQVQDLLRVPFCSACGHIAKAQYEEMYTSSSKIVEKLVENVEIDNRIAQ